MIERIGLSYYQLFINIAFPEGRREDKKLVNSEIYPFYDCGKNFGY